MRRLCSVLVLLVFHAPSQVGATHLDPTTMEVMGFDPSERKVFVMRQPDQVLYVMDLRRGDEARFVRVRTWPSIDDPDYRVRLNRLSRRLVPMTEGRTGEYHLRTVFEAQSAEMSAETRRMGAELHVPIACDHARIELAYRSRVGHLELEVLVADQPRVSIRGIYQVPGEDVFIGVIRALTTASPEGFYTDEHLVILR